MRIFRACSEPWCFRKVMSVFIENHFPRRGYCRHAVKRAFQHLGHLNYDDTLQKVSSRQVESDSAPFIFGYNTDVNIERILKDAAVQVIAQLPGQNLTSLLPQNTIYKPARNLQSHLIKASLTRPA